MFSGYGFMFGDDCGPDRSSWSDKSDAALRRENQAKRNADAFLEKCTKMDATDTSVFPITEEVVAPTLHLTGPCYTSFRKYAIGKGCKVQRREITHQEKHAMAMDKTIPNSSIKRGKMYSISVVLSTHPGKLAAKKLQDEQAAKERAEKQKAAAVKKAQKEKDLKERATQEFAKLKDGSHPVLAVLCNNSNKRSLDVPTETGSHDKENAAKQKAKVNNNKKSKTTTNDNQTSKSPGFAVPQAAMIERLEEDRRTRRRQVQSQIAEEERVLLNTLHQKETSLQAQVDQDCARLQTIILDASK